MHDEDNEFNGFSHRIEWYTKFEDMHPYTYNWVEKLAWDIINADEVSEIEAQLDRSDYLLDFMSDYPDAENIIAKIRSNVA